MLALRLPPEIEARLDALAKLTGRTKSFYAREAILRQIEDLEDYYLARQRRARGAPRVALETIERETRKPAKRAKRKMAKRKTAKRKPAKHLKREAR